jgi:hypothetical protein
MNYISDADLECVQEMVNEQRAIPAVIVAALLARLARAERLVPTLRLVPDRRSLLMSADPH